ncbi:hypothetical protein MUY27_12565 [Mucilaginibacter sp. RS28]|uniref:VOC domain-containing protein n=1 Tax=Mucilaginibacter straminoryzae TaxID=2932774 RepID=A0A9X2BDP5_9SPHI|nr:VOC family protein [Mucilaginibacter straminoryzae]MCJ8210543.1 hypothetical protein [Mucilaginibacter straminoryzae]
MNIKFSLDTIIFYVQDVDRLKSFYQDLFGGEVVEEFESVWALLQLGSFKIGLHRMGDQYFDKTKGPFKFDNNTKIVFELTDDINAVRAYLVSRQVAMREIKTFDDYDYWLCDGEDPEGNVFQLKQRK